MDKKYEDSILMQDSVRDAFMVALKKDGFSMNSTSEEELQQAKQDLAETVTGSADGAILSMKPEELLQLLQEE